MKQPSITRAGLRCVTTAAAVAVSVGLLPSAESSAAPDTPGIAARLAGKTIFLDPGHQGPNHTEDLNRPVDDGRGGTKACQTTGMTTMNGVPEHTVNWNVAQLVRQSLEALGARVVLSRPDDTGWGGCVDERAAAANASGADVALSIHADSAPAADHGFHLIIPQLPIPDATADQVQAGAGLAASKAMRDAYVQAGFSPANYAGAVDGLMTRSDIAGPALTRVPDVFVEMGNGGNADDAKLLESPEGQLKHAVVITTGLVGYLLGIPTSGEPARGTENAAVVPGAATPALNRVPGEGPAAPGGGAPGVTGPENMAPAAGPEAAATEQATSEGVAPGAVPGGAPAAVPDGTVAPGAAPSAAPEARTPAEAAPAAPAGFAPESAAPAGPQTPAGSPVPAGAGPVVPEAAVAPEAVAPAVSPGSGPAVAEAVAPQGAAAAAPAPAREVVRPPAAPAAVTPGEPVIAAAPEAAPLPPGRASVSTPGSMTREVAVPEPAVVPGYPATPGSPSTPGTPGAPGAQAQAYPPAAPAYPPGTFGMPQYPGSPGYQSTPGSPAAPGTGPSTGNQSPGLAGVFPQTGPGGGGVADSLVTTVVQLLMPLAKSLGMDNSMMSSQLINLAYTLVATLLAPNK
ncbi:N-acetylmuramoyl-L-alanine amidase [Nocardia sp. alder85J]|uniref:N-acetylmuramoyl-L-alanine amidase n=1 Tax=Nocardia sp. alder85J TaxID=2862949 RepID=UPI003A4E5675